MNVSDQILFSNRLIWTENSTAPVHIDHMIKEESYLRYIPFFLQPDSYTNENRRTIECFNKYLVQHIGHQRLLQVSKEVGVDLDEMWHKGASLNERVVAKLYIASKQVSRGTMQYAIESVHRGDSWIENMDTSLRMKLLGVHKPEELSSEVFHKLYQHLENPFQDAISFTSGTDTIIENALTVLVYFISKFIFDEYQFIKSRVLLAESNETISQEAFYERMAIVFASQEEMPIGGYLRGPNDSNGTPVYYRLAAKLITADGQFSLCFLPAHDSDQKPIRVTRGTSFSLSGLDAISYLITDAEEEVGYQGYNSGKSYEPFIEELGVSRWVEIGYSAGGTIAQWRVAYDLDKVESLWTFRAPGVPERVSDKFLQSVSETNRSFTIHVARAVGDFIDLGGDAHLGKNAPYPAVDIHLNRFTTDSFIPHLGLAMSNNSRSGIQGGFSREEINAQLDNRGRSGMETFRKFLGGQILAPLLIKLREILRSVFGSRAEVHKGLWMEDRSTLHWRVKRIIPSLDNPEEFITEY